MSYDNYVGCDAVTVKGIEGTGMVYSKHMLSLASPYFKAMFASGFVEGSTKDGETVANMKFELSTIKIYINYLEQRVSGVGKLDTIITRDSVIALVQLADHIGDNQCIRKCDKRLATMLYDHSPITANEINTLSLYSDSLRKLFDNMSYMLAGGNRAFNVNELTFESMCAIHRSSMYRFGTLSKWLADHPDQYSRFVQMVPIVGLTVSNQDEAESLYEIIRHIDDKVYVGQVSTVILQFMFDRTPSKDSKPAKEVLVPKMPNYKTYGPKLPVIPPLPAPVPASSSHPTRKVTADDDYQRRVELKEMFGQGYISEEDGDDII